MYLVQEDLSPLWQTDLGGAPAGAVIDGLDAQLKQGEPLLGVPRVASYFNAGVLLIDVPRWRQLRVSEKALAYLRSHPQSPYMDQDGLNVALDGCWTWLDPRWNFQDHYETHITSLQGPARPAVVHFVTRTKPWRASRLSPNWRFYDRVRRRTAYARSRAEILDDAVASLWARTKRMLRQFRTVQSVERRFRRRAVVVSSES